jgi:hypothetical protein
MTVQPTTDSEPHAHFGRTAAAARNGCVHVSTDHHEARVIMIGRPCELGRYCVERVMVPHGWAQTRTISLGIRQIRPSDRPELGS